MNAMNDILLYPPVDAPSPGSEFPLLLLRFLSLQRWLEQGTRPSPSSPLHLADSDLFQPDLPPSGETALLTSRIYSSVLPSLNVALSSLVSSYGPKLSLYHLSAKPSTIPNAGLGLFNASPSAIRAGSTITYYYGELCTLRSANRCRDKRYHLLLPVPEPNGWSLPDHYAEAYGVPEGERLRPRFPIILDCGPLPSFEHMPARYVNDPRAGTVVNARFAAAGGGGVAGEVCTGCPSPPPPPNSRALAAALVATKDIEPGEEIFADYGDAYWEHGGGEEEPCTLPLRGGCTDDIANGTGRSARQELDDDDDDDDECALFKTSFTADWGPA